MEIPKQSYRPLVARKKILGEVNELTVIPSVEALVCDALSVISSELSFYKAKTARGARLDMKEARVVRDYVEALCKLTREAREAAKQEDLSNLSDKELLELASTLVKPEEIKR
jgi:hypothetical protein